MVPVPKTPTAITLDANFDATGTATIQAAEVDYYSFTAPVEGGYHLSVQTPSSNVDPVLGLYASNGHRIAYNDDTSWMDTDSYLTVTLTAGTKYYVGITKYNGTASGAYTWAIDGPTIVVDDALESNDTQQTAYSFGQLSEMKQVDNLIMADGHDWYRFSFTTNATANNYVRIAFTHDNGDLDMTLVNTAGTVLRSSQGFTNTETISLNTLPAGTYYLHVYGYRGVNNPNYSLQINPPGPVANPTIDLRGAGLGVSPFGQWGQTITVSGSVANAGNVISSDFSVQWYLSQDAVGSADDILLSQASNLGSSASYPAVPGGFTGDPFTTTLQLPTSLPAGWTGSNFFIVMRTDSTNKVAESDETNNFGQMGDGLDSAPLTITVNPPPSGFHIQLNITGMNAAQMLIFQQAAARWEQVILGDLPDAVYNGRVVDDLLIDASGQSIDGRGGILGQAGPDRFRNGSTLPYHGVMEFDTADLASMQADGSLRDVILHEMGHVLGIGTIWSSRGLLRGAGGNDPRFTGAQATAAYNQIFGRNDTGVPVENTGGGGTRDSHWRESIFRSELMTGWIGPGTRLPMSRVTVASLADLGYQVNLSAADNFTSAGTGGVMAAGATSGGNSHTDHALAPSAVDVIMSSLVQSQRDQGRKEDMLHYFD